MDIKTQEYKAAEAEINWLEELFTSTEMQAKKIQDALSACSEQEMRVLLLDLGRIMDKHAQNMQNI